jgi:hypothetical protein
VTENKSLLRNFDQIVENINTKDELVIDVRAPGAFKGSHDPQVTSINCFFEKKMDLIKTKNVK